MAQPTENARSYTLPAPVGGWNTRDPLVSMPETDAIVMDNVIPQSAYCRARGGFLEHADVGSSTVHTLAVYTNNSATEFLIAVCGTDIYNATTAAAPSSIKGAATITSNVPWQFVNFRNKIFLVNGTDQPLEWAGTGNVAATAWTGSGLTITNLINVSVYKRRLYFVEKNTKNVWYTEAVDNTSGPLLPFSLNSLFTLGGELLYAGPTSTSSSRDVSAELMVFVSSQGEVVVYAGDNPLSTTWEIVGHYYLGRALGSRCGFLVGGDLHLITYDGVVPLSQLLAGVDITNDYQTLSGKVKPSFIDAATKYADNSIWMGHHFASGPYAVVNVPIQDYGNAYQFVFNTVTKAWCRWTNLNAHSWASIKISGVAVLLFGSNTGGKIYRVDDQTTLQYDDDGAPVPIDVQHAYSYLGTPQRDKIIQYIQPLFFLSQNHIQSAGEGFNMGPLFDYDEISSTSSLPLYNLTVADQAFPSEGVNTRPILDSLGSGDHVSIRYASNLRNDATGFADKGLRFRHYATKVYFTVGSEIA